MRLRGGHETEDPRLDRIPFFDPRSRDWPVTAVIQATQPRSYTWNHMGHWLDQGREGACVGFAVAHELAARPVTVQGVTDSLARSLYLRAQQIDEWPGESYEGTSVLAGVKAASERGHYGEYRWAFGEDDLAMAIGYKGPAILGVPWYEGMYAPDRAGYIRPTGRQVGGHAILCTGISVSYSRYRLHNSWGADWGMKGDAYITRDDMRLLLQNQGEACIPLKRLAL